MGVVYRARDSQTGRPVALKLFETRGAADVKRADQEVEVLARLRHPAIVGHIADGVTDRGALYLVMEWVDGITLGERLDTGALAIGEVLALGRRLAHALAAAHEAGIIHRDVKPSNVLLAQGRPDAAILIDFGIARVTSTNVKLTRTGITVGTPGYMAPEQARGVRAVTPACDVFSLGCVLYECLTARPAFYGESLAATLAKIVFSDPEPLTNYRQAVPPALVELIGRMLTRDAARRPADARAIASALESIEPDEPSQPPVRTSFSGSRAHCMVIAINVREAPPTDEQLAAVCELAKRSGARAELLETNHVCVHLEGEPNVTLERAATIAVQMRGILTGWMIGISSEEADARLAADTGTDLLARLSLAAAVRKVPRDAIVASAKTRARLERSFELADHDDYEAFEIRGLKTTR
jgi:serine/threonine protein kinase